MEILGNTCLVIIMVAATILAFGFVVFLLHALWEIMKE